MDKQTTKMFHRLLREQRTQVVKRYFEHAEQGKLASEQGIDDCDDIAERLRASSARGSLAGLELHLLDQIDLALCRIAEGNYGKCVICGQSVLNARLLSNPAVSMCAGCGDEPDPLIERCGF